MWQLHSGIRTIDSVQVLEMSSCDGISSYVGFARFLSVGHFFIHFKRRTTISSKAHECNSRAVFQLHCCLE